MNRRAFAVFGSGFGLYGYVPALVGGCHVGVVLPAAYRETFDRRPELAPYRASVDWAADDAAALDRAEGVVLARRPADNHTAALACLERPGIASLLLEKPIAPDPAEADRLLDRLVRSGIAFRIGYLFRFTPWGRTLLDHKALDPDGLLEIEWHFMAHHFRHDLDNWKRDPAAGGGPLRFYGIHLLALLAEMGYRTAVESRMSLLPGMPPAKAAYRWRATFTGPGLPTCRIDVNSAAPTATFRVTQSGATGTASVRWVDLSDPFEGGVASRHAADDRRVPLLARHCDELLANVGTASIHEVYGRTNSLWSEAERRLERDEGQEAGA